MRKLALGIIALLYTAQSGLAETVITAQDAAVDSDVVLESALKELKSAPSDTVNVIGDGIKLVTDEVATATKGVAAVFKGNPVEKAEKAGMIEVANAWDASNDILFRSYKVSDEVGQELMQGASAFDGSTVDVSDFFTGIDFPQKTSVYFRPEFNRLFVRHTLANILAIEDVLAEQHSAVRDLLGKQVAVETKFVEVNQSTLNELGFDWTLTSAQDIEGDTVINPQPIFSAGLRSASDVLLAGTGVTPGTLSLARAGKNINFDLVISALEQADDTDVLSAPSIVTRDGNTATIQVGEERTVSLGFDVKQAESSLFVEHDLESQLMGVSLEVTPEIRSDDLLDLELKPKIIDLIGYDTYEAHPDADMLIYAGQSAGQMVVQGKFPILNYTKSWQKMFDTLGGDPNTNYYEGDTKRYLSERRRVDNDEFGVPLNALNGRIPYYRLREIETQVTVADGSTVGMGGLIYDKLETYKDKVPVLGSIPLVGRIFRSEGEKSVKRNLLIFVTATQVDVNGRKASELALKR